MTIISLLKDAKKSIVNNKTDPFFDKLPEADISDMEAFLEELQLVLPVIGVDFLRKPKQISQASESTEPFSEIYSIKNKNKGIDARAYEADGEFIVLRDSIGSLNETISFDDRRQTFRNQVFESGRAEKIDAKNFRLLDDVAFSSPSAASVFLHGTSRNGRTDWMVEGKSLSYADWKDQTLEANLT